MGVNRALSAMLCGLHVGQHRCRDFYALSRRGVLAAGLMIILFCLVRPGLASPGCGKNQPATEHTQALASRAPAKQADKRQSTGDSASSSVPANDNDPGPGPEKTPTTFAQLAEEAKTLAAAPFVEPVTQLPPLLERMDYDSYRRIQFRQKAAVWADTNLPFQLRMYHRGGTNRQRVNLFTFDDDQAKRLKFDPSMYQYDLTWEQQNQLPEDLGFAGMWVLTDLNNEQGRPIDELMSFLGGCYFRALSKGQHYGASCRGLGLNISHENEEFPTFKSLYVQRPDADSESIRILALLDSPSIAGAYRFEVDPGSPTVVDVKARLFPRSTIQRLNIAPITSMFLFGEQKPSNMNEDFRPEVHDSDGLLMVNGDGETIFRPLQNANYKVVSQYNLKNPRGFGLIQRDRDFESYQDLEALYQHRPSVWIEPRPVEGSGSTSDVWSQSVVELVEFPSDNEGYDNINASWIYPGKVAPGKPIDLAYRIHLYNGDPPSHQAGKAVATRFALKSPEKLRWLVDFSGGRLDDLPKDAPIEAVVTADGVNVARPISQHNPYQGGWRVQVEVSRPGGRPVEVRAFLKLGDDVLTETWSYQWTP